MRIDPPPSVACAAATIPDATAAADPPLEPPGDRDGFDGLRVAPYATGSVVGSRPSSGVLVLPRKMNPAARNLAARYVSSFSIQCAARNVRIPAWNGSPAECAPRSFNRNGT